MNKTKHLAQKLIINKLFNYAIYSRLRLFKHTICYYLNINKDPIFKLLPSLLKKNAVVFDIGANIGQSALFLSKIVGRKGVIYSFEPINENYNFLIKAKSFFKWNNVKTFKIAISDYIGTENMYIPIINKSLIIGTRSVLEKSANSALKEFTLEKVRTNTIDNFSTENSIIRLDFIKSDTEGACNRVVQGGYNTIKKFKPILILELSHNNKSLSILYEIGYKPYYIYKNKFVSAYKLKEIHGDVVLIHKNKNSDLASL